MTTFSERRIILAFAHTEESLNSRALRERAAMPIGRVIADAVTQGYLSQKNTLGGPMYRLSDPGKQLRQAFLSELSSR